MCAAHAAPTVAIATAISASVTVSIGELTMGTRSLILRVTLEDKSTCGEVAGWAAYHRHTAAHAVPKLPLASSCIALEQHDKLSCAVAGGAVMTGAVASHGQRGQQPPPPLTAPAAPRAQEMRCGLGA